MDKEKIINMANLCLCCPAKFCSIKGCPMQTNIPEFINEIKKENFEEAYNILMENNICSHICSIVCPQEQQCEGSCVRGIKGKPTQIGELEKFVNEWADENNINYNYTVKQKNGKKVAIIGSGPAGIMCAFELLKNGCDVVIYEKEKIAGGTLVYGIPDFRLSKELVKNVIDKLVELGAIVKNNIEFGKDITLEKLKKEYDAIFIGIGAMVPSSYKLLSEEANGIYNSDYILNKYNLAEKVDDLGDVIVIGGGNVAMDTARTAKRLGALSVKIVYRRDKENMPARSIELEDAIEEGIEFVQLTRVISAESKNNRVSTINCIKTKLENGKCVDIEDSEFQMKADTVIFAIGLKPEKAVVDKEGIRLNEYGLVEIDENGMTNLEGIFAGGDLTQSKSTVCRALAEGKKASKGILTFLKV